MVKTRSMASERPSGQDGPTTVEQQIQNLTNLVQQLVQQNRELAQRLEAQTQALPSLLPQPVSHARNGGQELDPPGWQQENGDCEAEEEEVESQAQDQV